jgi:hypothetical protein
MAEKLSDRRKAPARLPVRNKIEADQWFILDDEKM